MFAQTKKITQVHSCENLPHFDINTVGITTVTKAAPGSGSADVCDSFTVSCGLPLLPFDTPYG